MITFKQFISEKKLPHELDPNKSLKHAIADRGIDWDNDGDVDDLDRKHVLPDEITATEKPDLTPKARKKNAAELKHIKKGVAYEETNLDEITRLPVSGFTGGKEILRSYANMRVKTTPLPGGSGFTYAAKQGPRKIEILIYDPENSKKTPIGVLDLKSYTRFPAEDAHEVNIITVDEDYRGQSIAKSLYGIYLSILKKPLVAGSMQTPAGRRNWVSLSRIPGVDVIGYVALDRTALTPRKGAGVARVKESEKFIDILMGKLGAQYMGKVGMLEYFAYAVKPNNTNKELKADVITKLSKVYSDYPNWDILIKEVGMYADWHGTL